MLLKEFFAKLGLKVDDAAFSRAEALLAGVKDSLLKVGAAAGAAAVGLGAMVASTVHDAGEIAQLASLAGVTTDRIQELGFVANKFGVDARDMGELLSELAENLGEAAGGTGEAADAFKSLGISTKDAKGKTLEVDAALAKIADKFKELPDGQRKTAALMGLFGEQGIALLPILNKGSAGIEELAGEARALGLVMSEDAVGSGAALAVQMKDVESVIASLKQAIAGAFMADIAALGEAFLQWWRINNLLIRQNVGAVFKTIFFFLKPVIYLFALLGKVAAFVVQNFQTMAVVAGSVLLAALVLNASAAATLATSYLAAGAAAVFAAIRATLAWVAAAAPVVALAALFALLILLLQDIYVWLQGGDSLVGAMWERWKGFIKDWLQPAKDDPWWLRALKAGIDTILNFDTKFKIALRRVADGWDSLVQYMNDVFWDLIDSVVDGIKEALSYLPGVDFEEDDTPSTVKGKINAAIKRAEQPVNFFDATAAEQEQRTLNSFKGISPTFNAEIKIEGVSDPKEAASATKEELGEFWNREMRSLKAVE